MHRETSSLVSLLLCVVIILNMECTSGIPGSCLELVRFDVDEIESHLSGLNLTDVPTVKMMTAGFKCPISALPFGTLKSDWARLLLLREAQPDGSIIKIKLVQLMRILIIAYYQMEEHIDTTGPEVKAAKKTLKEETTTTVLTTPSQPHCPNSDNSLGAEIPSNNTNHCSCTDSFDATRLATENDCSRIKSNATVIEIATMRNFSSPDGTTTVVPFDATRPNVTSLIDLGATTTYYPGNVKKAALKILGKCLKYSLKDIARQPNGKVFEIVKSKHIGRVARKSNETDDRGRNRTVIRISPPTNTFWRYVTVPTRPPLSIASIAPAYRVRRLNGLRTGPQKSRKRVKLDNDIYENFRRFYGLDQNDKSTKKFVIINKSNTTIKDKGKNEGKEG